jgi:hypothetical protein
MILIVYESGVKIENNREQGRRCSEIACANSRKCLQFSSEHKRVPLHESLRGFRFELETLPQRESVERRDL